MITEVPTPENRIKVGDVVMIHATEYRVKAVKPYKVWKVDPETKKRERVRLCDNILLAVTNGDAQFWLADYAVEDWLGKMK